MILMGEGKFGRILFKVALGVAGFIVGGYAGFWIVAVLTDATLPPPQHQSTEPMTGMASGLLGLFLGFPLGGLATCALAVRYGDKLAIKIGDAARRLRNQA
jgi:hypothetical protein